MLKLILTFTLTICFNYALPQLNLYYGNLHSHTDYTGGVADPLTAFNYARDVAQIDFLAVTDHNEGLNDAEWDSTLAMAYRANLQGGFVALTGYEWTSPVYNHVNVFNTTDRVSRIDITDWNAFLQEVIGFGSAFCQFNHPGFIGSNNWDSFLYLNPQTDSVFRLIEVRNLADEEYYIMALNNGWHVSATNNQDNHNADWGNSNDCRTGIWAESLIVSDILNAMYLRRTFSTMDKNASVWLDVNGINMGSIINSTLDYNIHFCLNDNDGENWEKIDIVGEGGAVINTTNNHSAQFDTTFLLTELNSKYIFIRGKQNDGDYIWSAPIFINNNGNSVTEIKKNNLSFNVYPNLINENFYLTFNLTDSELFKVKLCELSGRVIKIYDQVFVNKNNNNVAFSRQGVKNGIYILSVESENWFCSKKIIFI